MQVMYSFSVIKELIMHSWEIEHIYMHTQYTHATLLVHMAGLND